MTTHRTTKVAHTLWCAAIAAGLILSSCAAGPRLRTHYGHHEVTWPANAYPLSVVYAKGMSDVEIWALHTAESAWESASGRLLFVADPDHELKLPQVEVAHVSGAVLHSSLEVDDDGIIHRCRITIGDAAMTPTVLRRALAHELGHCLGYADDGTHGSIMHDGYAFGR